MLRRAGIEVVTAGLETQPQPVVASRGTVLLPDATLDEVLPRDFDMVVLPGGLPGADHLKDDPRIIALVRRQFEQHKYLAAICAAPKVLAAAGILNGRRATSFPGSLDGIDVPGLAYETGAVVRDGNLITSRGPGTAMDFALALIELLAGTETRDAVEAKLQRP